MIDREREKALVQGGAPLIQPQRVDQARFTGGGFNLKTTKTAAWKSRDYREKTEEKTILDFEISLLLLLKQS